MNISTTANSQRVSRADLLFYSLGLILPGIVLVWTIGKERIQGRRLSISLALLGLLALAFYLPSCGGVSSGGGGGGNCSSAPGIPSGLAASSTTSTGTTLSWNASTATAGCSVLGYPVYQNGSSIATATGTTYNVTGLSPSTTYSFSVAAGDSAGVSAQTVPISVTTSAGGTAYTITITGTSLGTPSDAGQSTQVTLVVN